MRVASTVRWKLLSSGLLQVLNPALLLSGVCWLLFPGTMGKDKSWLSWLLTEEINHMAHRRIPFQPAGWERHYPAPATHYYAERHWLGQRRCGQPTSVTTRAASDLSQWTLPDQPRGEQGEQSRGEDITCARLDMKRRKHVESVEEGWENNIKGEGKKRDWA